MEDRIETARQVIRDFDVDDEWERVVENGIPPELESIRRGLTDAYRRADIEWLLEHTDPEAVISQLAELPDSKTYRGREGLIDALLDWPRQWQDFRMEPLRVFSVGDDQLVIVAIHRGRPHTIDIEVEAEIVFLLRWRDRRMTDWKMFLTVDEALEAAEAAQAR
jgi:ketosteroid isomerase-like protein